MTESPTTQSDRISRDLLQALKQHDETKLSTLRLLKAAAHNAAVAKRAPLTDAEYQDVITRQAKLRREAVLAYERAGRPDRAEQERMELAVLEHYLPEQVSDHIIRSVVQQAIATTGAHDLGDTGKIMSLVMPSLKGRADGKRVNVLVRELLTVPPE